MCDYRLKYTGAEVDDALAKARSALQPGEVDDGFSPTVTLTRMGNGVQIKVVNKDSESTAMVYDGETTSGTGGGTGKDGGYYIPSVSAQGVLSWNGSQADMPTVESANIRGPKGDAPVRGTDYWTASDIAEIKAYVDDAILGGAW